MQGALWFGECPCTLQGSPFCHPDSLFEPCVRSDVFSSTSSSQPLCTPIHRRIIIMPDRYPDRPQPTNSGHDRRNVSGTIGSNPESTLQNRFRSSVQPSSATPSTPRSATSTTSVLSGGSLHRAIRQFAPVDRETEELSKLRAEQAVLQARVSHLQQDPFKWQKAVVERDRTIERLRGDVTYLQTQLQGFTVIWPSVPSQGSR